MNFRDKDYYQAGLERMQQAEKLYAKGGAYALAMYCSGLAVECLFRAFRWSETTGFEGRHDLSDLLKACGILRVDDDFMRRRGKSEESIHESSIQFRSAMNEVVTLWHNNLRFASEARLKAYLKKIKRVHGIKGDSLKKNAADLINAANLILIEG